MRRCQRFKCEEPSTWKTYIEGDDEREEYYCDYHREEIDADVVLWGGEPYEWQEIEMRGREPR